MLKYKPIPTADLIPYARNSRTHSEAQIAKIASSIREFGFINPVVTDGKNGIVAGHGRVLAAHKLGLKDVPCVEASHLTEAQKRAYIIADNRMALDAGWDAEMLKVELGELKGLDFDLALTGFELGEIESFLADKTEGLTDPDAVPETPANAVSVLGDTWVLGKHRLRCGDSTSATDVEALMAGSKADMTFTSPPYNANAKAGQGDIFNGKKSVKLYSKEYQDNLPSSDYVQFARDVLEICFAVTDGFIFWNVSYNAKSRHEYIEQIINRLPFLVEQVCWKKNSTIPFKGSLMRDWEPIYIFSTNKQPVSVKEVTSNFWQISNTGAQSENHKACFPVALPQKGMSIVAVNTNIVFEPFSGSGTTIIAGEMAGRAVYAMELSPQYVDVAIKRWQDFTGEKAVLEGDGRTFEDISAARYDAAADGAGSYTDAIAAKRAELEAAK